MSLGQGVAAGAPDGIPDLSQVARHCIAEKGCRHYLRSWVDEVSRTVAAFRFASRPGCQLKLPKHIALVEYAEQVRLPSHPSQEETAWRI
eukprot:10198067-Alexandrium_andersonii.AAC.1